MTRATFTDKLGIIGRTGDQVIVPVCGDDGMPQLAIAEVVVVVREPNPFASELSVRTRLGNDESCVYEPDEVVLRAVTGPDIAATRALRTILARPEGDYHSKSWIGELYGRILDDLRGRVHHCGAMRDRRPGRCLKSTVPSACRTAPCGRGRSRSRACAPSSK